MSDRAAWLEEWCPCCREEPGARCRTPLLRKTRPPERLHCARGWRMRQCPTCKVPPQEPCRTPSGREASGPHTARLRPGRYELLARPSVWQALEQRGATIATVPFAGHAGEGGRVGTVVLSRRDAGEAVDVYRCIGGEELGHALAAPLWDRFGLFAGQPGIVGTVTWTAAGRSVVIAGRRGGARFEETV